MENKKLWIRDARKFLESSLLPIPHELNELDWKIELSKKNDKLAEHISAFANHHGGGFFVFGIDSSGEVVGVDDCSNIIATFGNIARDGVEPPQRIDHFIDTYKEKKILFVHVLESNEKPAHLRGKGIEFSFIRSGGQTRRIGRQELGQAVLSSQNIRYEELQAFTCSMAEVLELLNYEKLFELLQIPLPLRKESIVEILINLKLVYKNSDSYSITNLGVIVAAHDMKKFPGKERYSVRVIKYRDNNRLEADKEQEFSIGYGVGFQNIVSYVLSQLPTSEVIRDAIRTDVSIYPHITIRELVANSMIHRDFSVTATHLMIEIFSDRMEITSPGGLLPSVKVERIIDTSPESRNELFASMMRRMGICEERGSGIDKALNAIELFGLPPIEFIDNEQTFKTIMFAPKKFQVMTQAARLRACYQHSVLKYLFNEQMTNASFRKRLGLNAKQYQTAWDIITRSIQQGLIKQGDESSNSKRYAYYLPYWA